MDFLLGDVRKNRFPGRLADRKSTVAALPAETVRRTPRDRSNKKESERRRDWNWHRGRKKFEFGGGRAAMFDLSRMALLS